MSWKPIASGLFVTFQLRASRTRHCDTDARRAGVEFLLGASTSFITGFESIDTSYQKIDIPDFERRKD